MHLLDIHVIEDTKLFCRKFKLLIFLNHFEFISQLSHPRVLRCTTKCVYIWGGEGLLGRTVSTIHSSQFKAQYLATLQQHHVSKFMKFAFKNLRWHVTCMTSRIFFFSRVGNPAIIFFLLAIFVSLF